ncbi:MDR family MFS transporter [soil metagenome]
MAVSRSILSREYLPASIAIFTAVAIVAFEGLAVTAALPELAAELGGVSLLPWVVTGFLMASGVSTAVTGSLIDSHGTASVFRVATLAFALASLGAAVAPSMPLLVGARVLQGAAGGAIISVGVAAVALVYPGHLVGRALAANANVWGVLGFAGPAIAAAMLQFGSWRWIFLLMIPLAVVALAAGWKALPHAVDARPSDIDWVSVGLLVVSVGSVLGATSDLSARSPLLIAVASLSGTLVWRRIGKRSSPLIDRRFIAARPYGQLAAAAGLTLAAMGGMSAYLPVYVRAARGGSATAAAWSVLWMTLGWVVAANIAGRITDRVPAPTVLTAGAALAPIVLAGAGVAVALEAPLPVVFAAYVGMGASVGTVTNTSLQLVREVVPPNLAGRATSAHAFARTMGMSLGAGLTGGVLLATVATRVSDISSIRGALAGEATELAGSAASALGEGFAFAHLVALALVGVATAAVVSLRRGTMTGAGDSAWSSPANPSRPG